MITKLEFRLVDKEVLDSILIPTEIIRPTPYTMEPEYEHLAEEPREIYMSSAFYKSHWMWQHIKDTVKEMYQGRAVIFGMDLALTLKHRIKTRNQLLRAKRRSDSLTFDMEYNNIMVGGSENQFYSFELVSSAQKLKKAFYPKTTTEYIEKKKKRFGDIKKVKGEVRIVAMDIAVSESRERVKNDLSVIKCIRALPLKDSYERQEVYTLSYEGCPIEEQAIKVRRIMDDFEADVFVYDGQTYGTMMADAMAKPLYDEERDVEYPPIKTSNREELKNRCKFPNAPAIMWAYKGSAELNNDLHTSMRSSLMSGKYKMLISGYNAQNEFLENKNEYVKGSAQDRARYMSPYLMSDLTLNEMINLSQDIVQGKYIKLEEPSTGTKDKYVTSAMANLYVRDVLEVKLSKGENKTNKKKLLHFRKPKTHY